MKLKCLLLFAAPALFLGPVQIVNSAPARIAYESRSQNANQIFQQVNPAVVTIYAGGEIGSGSIVDANGYVITNNHVVRRSAQVVARMADGRRIPGQVIATDPRNDLALIRLSAGQLPTVAIASGTSLQPGQPVVAIGSPYGRPGVMTQGTFRSVRGNGDLQSQVVLEPGNSGGPLLNSLGEMIGVNKAILESARGSNTGISIATSAAIARRFLDSNIPGGLANSASPYAAQPQFAPPQRQPESVNPQYSRRTGRSDVVVPSIGDPWQSAQMPYQSPPNNVYSGGAPIYEAPGMPDTQYSQPYTNPTENFTGMAPATGARLGVVVDVRTMLIRQVEPGTAGALGGLRVGDRLVAINGAQLQSFAQLQAFMNQAPPVAAFTISRGGRAATVQVRF